MRMLNGTSPEGFFLVGREMLKLSAKKSVIRVVLNAMLPFFGPLSVFGRRVDRDSQADL